MEDLEFAIACYKEKAKLIAAVGAAYASCSDLLVTGARYEAWHNDTTGEIQEWMILEHRGGAIKVRTVNINSNAVNMMELGKLVYTSYYDEVKDYRNFIKKAAAPDTAWRRLV